MLGKVSFIVSCGVAVSAATDPMCDEGVDGECLAKSVEDRIGKDESMLQIKRGDSLGHHHHHHEDVFWSHLNEHCEDGFTTGIVTMTPGGDEMSVCTQGCCNQTDAQLAFCSGGYCIQKGVHKADCAGGYCDQRGSFQAACIDHCDQTDVHGRAQCGKVGFVTYEDVDIQSYCWRDGGDGGAVILETSDDITIFDNTWNYDYDVA